jgi:glycosyltransferase involved in cell wall biosynthesis
MKILFATKRFYLPQATGGSESSTHDLCLALLAKNHQCAVLAELKGKGLIWAKNRFIARLVNKKFIADHALGYPVFRGWNVENGAAEVFYSFKPDIVVIQAGQPLLIAEKFLNIGAKTIVYLRDVEFSDHGGHYQEKPNLSFIANSQYTAKMFEDEFKLTAKVIPPLVHFDTYRINSKREKVLFINPVPVKGVELAFKLANNNPDIPFLFVQSWQLSDEELVNLKRRAKESGNIEWLDKQSDMKNVYAQAKLLLMPSYWEEAWGRVITEAQVSGIPSLASNRGGLPESVGYGGVTLDPESNYEIWHDTLRRFWFDDMFYKHYSERALQQSLSKFIQPEFLIEEFIDFVTTV